MEAVSKRAQTKEHNRRAILEAAREVFRHHGYRAATVRDIIGATPLASGTFYNYFKSKEDVFAALRDELALELRPLLRAGRKPGQSAEDLVAGTFHAFLSQIASRASHMAAINSSEDHILSSARLAVIGADDLRRDIEAGIRRGYLRTVDAELLTAAMTGVAFEVADVMRRRAQPDVDGAARFCSDLILHGVVPERVGAALPLEV